MLNPVEIAAKRERQRIKQRLWRQQNPQKLKKQMQKRVKGKITAADSLLDNLVVTLNEDQLFYFLNHPFEKRSILAKKIGITKLQLNHYVELKTREESQC